MPGKQRNKTESTEGTGRVPMEFFEGALEMANAMGRSDDELMQGLSIKHSSLRRLRKGEATYATALRLRSLLAEWGGDVSKIPPLDGANDEIPPWKKEWIALGETLHRLANPKDFESVLEYVRAREHAWRVIKDDVPRL